MWNTNLFFQVFNRLVCVHFVIQIPESILLAKLNPTGGY